MPQPDPAETRTDAPVSAEVAASPDQAAAPDAAPASDAEALADAAEPGVIDQQVDAIMDSWFGWLSGYPFLQSLVVLAALVLVAWLAHLVVRRLVRRAIALAMVRLPDWWTTMVVEHKVIKRLVPLVPTIIIARGVGFVPHLPVALELMILRSAQAVAVLFVALAFGALLNAVNAIYNRYPIATGRPIKGYLQVAKILAYGAAGILILATIMGESPWIFLSGLGAMTAVLLLVFRDTLLSLVAGIQLVNNDLLRVGDWIEMPTFNADGDVIDISLNVVQVSNWDKTITSIPTHKFLEHSFKNWRGMSNSGGRRIKRAVHLDTNSIRFLTEEEIERFRGFRLLRDYIDAKSAEIEAYNKQHCVGPAADCVANARRMTNVGTFRAYIVEYLKHHPLIHQGMTQLVRQLQPGPTGLPIELYCFVKDTRWAVYENTQSDIFDHVFSIAGEFGLRVFQEPAGTDLAMLAAARGSEPEAGAPSPNSGTKDA
jgi:miniconductance mechanosensitive channel